jgi:transcriptional regulator with XRE-family HTH domain
LSVLKKDIEEIMTLPDLIKTYRAKSGLSLQAASSGIGVSINAWQRWEHGVNEPSLEHLRKLRKLLNIPVKELSGLI